MQKLIICITAFAVFTVAVILIQRHGFKNERVSRNKACYANLSWTTEIGNKSNTRFKLDDETTVMTFNTREGFCKVELSYIDENVFVTIDVDSNTFHQSVKPLTQKTDLESDGVQVSLSLVDESNEGTTRQPKKPESLDGKTIVPPVPRENKINVPEAN